MEQPTSTGVDDVSLGRVLRLAQASLGGFTPGLVLLEADGGCRFFEDGATAPAALIDSIVASREALWLGDCDAGPDIASFIAAQTALSARHLRWRGICRRN